MSDIKQVCPSCGRSIRGSPGEGLCPRCLLRGAKAARSERPPPPASSVSPSVGARLGDYELLEELARGGMGVVFRARQISLNRVVAVKLILSGALATTNLIKRFKTEAEAAARLDHPHIVPIYEIGEHDGHHFFSMKLVNGGTLRKMVTGRPAASGESAAPHESYRNKARLVATIARAVHYAHQRGVLHRDLKPSNILLDEHGAPQVSDFGLAKIVEHDSDVTVSAAILGTPAYMAPEQAAGRTRDLTTAADIYSLGAIFYELLTGRPPFVGESPMEIIRQVATDDVSPPSSWRNDIDADLETICLKCLEKIPARRYASAEALAEDLDRWRRGEPIVARPSTALERVVKWARRRPARAALVAVSAGAVVGFVALTWINKTRLKEERDYAVNQERIAVISEGVTRENLYAADVFLAQRALSEGNLGLARRVLAAHIPKTNIASSRLSRISATNSDPDLRGFEWHYLSQQCQGEQLFVLTGHSNAVSCLAFSRDGRTLVSGGADRVLRLWNTDPGAGEPKLIATLKAGGSELITAEFVASDRRIVAADIDGLVKVWDARTLESLFPFQLSPGRIAVASDGARFGFALDSDGGEVFRTYSLTTGRPEKTFSGMGRLAAFTHDGSRFGTIADGTVKIWNRRDGERIASWPAMEPGTALTFSRDDTLVAGYSTEGRSVQLWQADTGRSVGVLNGHLGRVLNVAFSPDGRLLATASADQTVRIWEVAEQRERICWRGHDSEVRAVAFSGDSRFVASAGKDGTVRLWSTQPKPPRAVITNAFPPILLSPDGQWLAANTGSRTDGVQPETVIRRVADGSELARHRLHPFRPVCFREDGALVAVNRPAMGSPFLLRVIGGTNHSAQDEFQLKGSSDVHSARFVSSDGRTLLGVARTGESVLYPLAGAGRGERLGGTNAGLPIVKLSPDGRRLAIHRTDSGAGIWDVASKSRVLQLEDAAAVRDFAFDRTGQLLAAAGADNDIRLWNTTNAVVDAPLAGHSEPVLFVALHPDGTTLASHSKDGTLKLWSVRARREVATLMRDASLVHLEFSADGRALIGVTRQGHLHFWRTHSERN